MHILTIKKWVKHLDYNSFNCRTGLRLIIDKNVDPEVKRACKEFCQWLRSEYYFPVRVPLYIKATDHIKALDGELVSATFFFPLNKNDEPYARVSTGDYQKLYEKQGKDNALAAILGSIAHELTHYFQWINGIELTEIGEERQAKAYSGYILDEYKETRKHP